MAIIKSLAVRGARKKMGGMVYYNLKGQNIVREAVDKVNNARTASQMRQRTRLSNLVQFYKRMKPWARKGAFETKPAIQSDYNAFVSANIGIQPVYLTKQQSAAGCCVVAPYTISRGSLLPIETRYYQIPNIGEKHFVSNIILPNDVDTYASLGELSRDIISNNPALQNGDQISVIVAIQQAVPAYPYVVMRYWELTLDVNSTEDADVYGSWLQNIQHPSGIGSCLSHIIDDANEGCAFIISRKVNGRLQVSTAQLTLTPGAASFLQSFVGSDALVNATASYGESEVNFLDPGTSEVRANYGDLGVSLLSVGLNGRTVPAGGNLGTKPSTLDEMFLNFSQSVSGLTLGQLQFFKADGSSIVAVQGEWNYNANGTQADISFDEQDVATIKAQWANIAAIGVVVDGALVRASFTTDQTGGEVDPGDVNP